MPSRSRNPHGSLGAYEDHLATLPTAIELADPRHDMPPTFTDGFQVMSPEGLPTIAATGGVGRLDSGSITVAADESLYAATEGVSYDGDLARQNLAPNPGFETNAVGYAAAASTSIARSTTAGHFLFGGAGLDVTRLSSIGTAKVDTTAQAVLSGHVYTATAWVKAAATGRSVTIQATYTAKDGAINTTTSVAVTDATSGFIGIRISAANPYVGDGTTLTISVSWASCAINEVHYLDGLAIWDRTAFTDLGWTFTNCTPYLVNFGTSHTLYLLSTVTTGSMKVDGPKVPYNPLLAYEASFQVLGTTNAQTFTSLLYFYDATLAPLQVDGGNLNEVLRTGLYTRGSNFTTGGTGRALVGAGVTVPAYVRTKLDIPVTAITQFTYVYNLRLTSGGTVQGHLRPVGGIDDLRLGTYTMQATDITASATALVTSDIIASASLASIVAASTPQAYLDSSNRAYQFQYSCITHMATDRATGGSVYCELHVSFDAGVTYTRVSRAWNYPNDGLVNRYFELSHSGTIHIPSGSTPYIKVIFYHDITAISLNQYLGSTNGAPGQLSWLLIPA